MNIKITNKYGATLKTANKYVEEDISITLDESFVQPFGTLEVTENGTHDVTNYESVNVNVASSGGGSENVLQKQINENTAMGLCSNWAYNISLDEYINSLDFHAGIRKQTVHPMRDRPLASYLRKRHPSHPLTHPPA